MFPVFGCPEFELLLYLFQRMDDEMEWNVYLELTNGKLIGFDFVVSATGVIPNGDLVTNIQ